MKTFNKRGDAGETSLLFDRRVPKDDPHCEAYGTIDEAVSALGITRNLVKSDRVRQIILEAQRELFKVSTELAAKADDHDRFVSSFSPVTDDMTARLEAIIDDLESRFAMPESFVVPGVTVGSAWLDLSRTIIRRAERRVVTLKQQGELRNVAVLRYLNRLADLLYTVARYEESLSGKDSIAIRTKRG